MLNIIAFAIDEMVKNVEIIVNLAREMPDNILLCLTTKPSSATVNYFTIKEACVR